MYPGVGRTILSVGGKTDRIVRPTGKLFSSARPEPNSSIAMKIRLAGVEDKCFGFEVAFREAPIRIGRDPDADVHLRDASVSRHHCDIVRVDGVLWVPDLDSTHGTFVNGFHIAQSHLLPGDELTVGTLRLRVLYESDEVDWFSAYEREMAFA